MSKARLVITAVVVEGRSQSEVARAYGMSQPWVSRLVARYRAEGEAAYQPRSLVAAPVPRPVTGSIVLAVFRAVVAAHGLPASVLTDNGLVYTTRFAGGRRGHATRNGFETELARLGIQQKNSSPNHPQTCGKIERFHQTLKRWLAKQPRARTLTELQAQLDRFRQYYNDQRPHRALGRKTPAAAYAARP